MSPTASLWSLSARGEGLRNLERPPQRKKLAWLEMGEVKPRVQQHGSWLNTVCGVTMETPQVHVRAYWTVLRLSQGLLGCYWIGNMPVWWNNLPRERKRPTRNISFLRLGKYKTKWKPKSLVAKSWMQSLRADGWSEYYFQGCGHLPELKSIHQLCLNDLWRKSYFKNPERILKISLFHLERWAYYCKEKRHMHERLNPQRGVAHSPRY